MPTSVDGVYIVNGILVDFYGKPIDISRYNLMGPTGAAGSNGIDGIGSTAYKYVHELATVFDGDIITITRAELEFAGPLPSAISTDPGFLDAFCDLQVQVYYLNMATDYWDLLPVCPIGPGQGVVISIDSITGDLTVSFSIGPISPAAIARIVVIA